MGLSMHLPGFLSNGYEFSCMLINGHNGGFINDYFIIVYDYRIGSSQVNGKFLLEDKDQIKQRIGRSPDLGDGLALTFAVPDQPDSMVI